MNLKMLGAFAAFIVTDFFFHIIKALAAGLKAETGVERVGAVLFGVIVLLFLMFIVRRYFPPSFFLGFTVATGLFLSFDIVVFHWVFQLHRITDGPEANWLEPILVMAGTIFVIFGIKKERNV